MKNENLHKFSPKIALTQRRHVAQGGVVLKAATHRIAHNVHRAQKVRPDARDDVTLEVDAPDQLERLEFLLVGEQGAQTCRNFNWCLFRKILWFLTTFHIKIYILSHISC